MDGATQEPLSCREEQKVVMGRAERLPQPHEHLSEKRMLEIRVRVACVDDDADYLRPAADQRPRSSVRNVIELAHAIENALPRLLAHRRRAVQDPGDGGDRDTAQLRHFTNARHGHHFRSGRRRTRRRRPDTSSYGWSAGLASRASWSACCGNHAPAARVDRAAPLGIARRTGDTAVARPVGLSGHLRPHVCVDERVAGYRRRRDAQSAPGRVAPVLRVRVRRRRLPRAKAVTARVDHEVRRAGCREPRVDPRRVERGIARRCRSTHRSCSTQRRSRRRAGPQSPYRPGRRSSTGWRSRRSCRRRCSRRSTSRTGRRSA